EARKRADHIELGQREPPVAVYLTAKEASNGIRVASGSQKALRGVDPVPDSLFISGLRRIAEQKTILAGCFVGASCLNQCSRQCQSRLTAFPGALGGSKRETIRLGRR